MIVIRLSRLKVRYRKDQALGISEVRGVQQTTLEALLIVQKKKQQMEQPYSTWEWEGRLSRGELGNLHGFIEVERKKPCLASR